MRRWILFACLILISALGVLVPATAQASTVAGGQLTSGQPVTPTISTPGQQFQYTFAATAGQHVTFQVTNFGVTDGGSDGTVYLMFYEPGVSPSSGNVYIYSAFSADTYHSFFTPAGGTWSVLLEPSGASVGSLTLTFADDVANTALTSTVPVKTTITIEGRFADYTFAATAGKHVTFQVSSFGFLDGGSDGSAWLLFYEPGVSYNSGDHYTFCAFTADAYCGFNAPVGGTWSALLEPSGASVGSLTLTFAGDVANTALLYTDPVKTTIKVEGQYADYTFSTLADTIITFTVTQFSFTNGGSGGKVYLAFYEPGVSYSTGNAYTYCVFSANGSCTLVTPVGGIWSALLEPSGASVGNLTLTMT